MPGLDRPAVEDGQIGLNSPVLVVGDVIVVGAALRATAPAPEFVAGFVRGFDVRTGEQLWSSIPFPNQASSATRPGATTPGGIAATLGCGPRCRPTRSSATSICRSKPLPMTSTAVIDGRQLVCREPRVSRRPDR